MIYVTPFAAAHYTQMAVQDEQQWLVKLATVQDLQALEGAVRKRIMMRTET